MGLETLKKRSEFQRVRGGGRASTTAFVLEGKARSAPLGGETGSRFGFTITKKLGNAVIRNRMRRRLKAALALIAPTNADPRFDYVLVARPPALDRGFVELTADLVAAFRRVHEPQRTPRATAKVKVNDGGVANGPELGDTRRRGRRSRGQK